MKESKEHYKEIINKWINDEKSRTCGAEAQKRYIITHKHRFNYLYNLCLKLNPDKKAAVLDVGRSQLSVMLSDYYKYVSTLGLDIDEDEGGHREIEPSDMGSIIFNLNKSKEADLWPDKKFDLIIYSEVIEHLYEAPEYTFLFFRSLLNTRGYLFCTTPNSAYLAKRICSIIGKNSLPGIRLYNKNPGHYREYTKKELINYAIMCDLKVIDHNYINFKQVITSSKYKIVRCISNIYPSLKGSQILILQK